MKQTESTVSGATKATFVMFIYWGSLV